MVNRKATIEKLTESRIQEILEREYVKNPLYIAENLYVFNWESDFLVKTYSGYWREVEIKISFSDFKNDAKNKKEKFEILENGELRAGCIKRNRPNYFSYCVTQDMVEKVKPLLPSYAGLYYVSNITHALIFVRGAKKLHSEKMTDEQLNLTKKFYYNYRQWKNKYDRYGKHLNDLRHQISFLKAEYKAATGTDVYENL